MPIIDSGSNTSGKANVDSNYNLNVVTPTTNTQAGYTKLTYTPTSTIAKDLMITEEGAASVVPKSIIYDLKFNSASTSWSGKIGTNATTMTKSLTNGFMRLNASAITTTTTGISIYSNRSLNVQEGAEIKVKIYLKHANAAATNKQVDVGLGYYAFAAGQAAAMNEFIGFRWTTTGGLQGVLETSQGGAPTSQTVSINSNIPYSDNVTREYEIDITESAVEFYVDGTYAGRLTRDPGSYSVIKGTSLPFMTRVFNSGTASAATTVDIGAVTVFRYNMDNQSYSATQAAMDNISYYWQPDLTTGTVMTHNSPASDTAPTAATATNAASVLNNTANMGGFYRMNGATITATAHSIFWVAGYQNPAIPTAAGVATNSRNFFVTSITVSPQVVTTVLVGGGYAANWFASIGSTALTSATTDADGTTAVAQKADRVVPLSRVTSFAAAAAVGTIETGQGDFTQQFTTPLVIHPGEFLKIGLRTLWVNAAVTSGTIDGSIMANGYWD